MLVVLTAFAASLLTVFSGFGLGTLLMPVMAVFYPVAVAVAFTALIHLLNNLLKLGMQFRHTAWPVVGAFGIPALLATLPGAWLLMQFGELPDIFSYSLFGQEAVMTPVKLVVGMLLLVFATVEGFNLAPRLKLPLDKLAAGGVISGFFGGLSGHQGAFRSPFLLHARLNKYQMVATNAAIACLVDLTRLAVYAAHWEAMADQVSGLLAATALSSLAGAVTGTLLIPKITIRLIQRMIAAMLYLVGILLLMGMI